MIVQKQSQFIDLQASSQIEDPYPMYDVVRSIDPVYWNADKGLWYITGHPELTEYLKDTRFSGRYYLENKDQTLNLSAEGIAFRRKAYLGGLAFGTFGGGRSLPTWDAPDHTQRRRILTPHFTPRAVESMRPALQGMVDSLMERLEGKSEVEFIRDFAYELPVNFVQVLMGIPDDQAPAYVSYDDYDKARRVKSGVATDADYQAVAESGEKYKKLLDRLMDTKREQPDDKVVSTVLNAQPKACPYSDADRLAEIYGLVHAGHSTTTAFLGNIVYFLLKFGQWEKVRDNHALIPTALEEVLRWDPPQQIAGRIAAEDIEFYGHTIKEGDIILGFPGAANRDPRVFDKPNEFNVERSPNPHLTFGLATHFCIGAPFGRLEGELMLKALFKRYPDLHLAGEAVHSHCIGFGLESLPVALG